MKPPGAGESAWFTRVGLPLSAQEHAELCAMLRELDPAPNAAIASAVSWQDAARALRAREADTRWWNAEEAERERLWGLAAERLTESELLARLAAASAAAHAPVRSGVLRAAARCGMNDPGLVRAATEDALLAVHQQALAGLAGAGAGHHFQRKFDLFAAGRWPLGLLGGQYMVF